MAADYPAGDRGNRNRRRGAPRARVVVDPGPETEAKGCKGQALRNRSTASGANTATSPAAQASETIT